MAGFFIISSYAGAMIRQEHPGTNAPVSAENPDSLFSINVANAQYTNNNANPTPLRQLPVMDKFNNL
ncbi:MAG: hypothetical protein U0519_03755 [Candidatus Gracilibacteria bacterium]